MKTPRSSSETKPIVSQAPRVRIALSVFEESSLKSGQRGVNVSRDVSPSLEELHALEERGQSTSGRVGERERHYITEGQREVQKRKFGEQVNSLFSRRFFSRGGLFFLGVGGEVGRGMTKGMELRT